MKEIVKYLCILSLVVLVSAGTSSLITIKPSTPKNVLVKNFNFIEQTPNFIKEGYSKGYVLKGIYDSGKYEVVVVMERY